MSSMRNTTVRRALHPASSTKQLYCADVPVLFSGSSRAFVINGSPFCKQSRLVNAAGHQQNGAEPGKPSPRSRHQSWPGNQRGSDCHYAPSSKYQLPCIAAIVQGNDKSTMGYAANDEKCYRGFLAHLSSPLASLNTWPHPTQRPDAPGRESQIHAVQIRLITRDVQCSSAI